MQHHSRALAFGDLRRFISAAAVNNDAFVAERKCVETACDIADLVQRYDDGAQSRQWDVPGETMVLPA
jgi:hypothetical protein